MAWEKRRHGLYFYKVVRLPDGRCVKEYFGRGLRAQIVALEVDGKKLARSQQRKVIRELKAATSEAEDLAENFHDGVSECLSAEMLAFGFHNPRSRGWRKIMQTEFAKDRLDRTETVEEQSGDHAFDVGPQGERSSASRTDSASKSEFEPTAMLNKSTVKKGRTLARAKRPEAATTDGPETAPSASAGAAVKTDDDPDSGGSSVPPVKCVEEMSFEELRRAASFGNQAAISRLRPLMDENASYYARLFCLSTKAKVKWFEVHCGEDLFQRDCLRRSIQDLAADLLKEGGSPLEKLLVDEVILCFLRSRFWIARETQSLGSEIAPVAAELMLEQSAKAQKQCLKAMNALRDFRNLVVRRSLSTPPKVIEATAADNAGCST
jgi:hypothetical protein